jgi:hypothetical protein
LETDLAVSTDSFETDLVVSTDSFETALVESIARTDDFESRLFFSRSALLLPPHVLPPHVLPPHVLPLA